MCRRKTCQRRRRRRVPRSHAGRGRLGGVQQTPLDKEDQRPLRSPPKRRAVRSGKAAACDRYSMGLPAASTVGMGK